MKKLTTRVLAVRNGSMYAVVGSGNSDMSDSWIAWKPRIEEPSKFRPSSKTAWSNDDTGTVKCCMTPGQVAEPDVDHLDALVLDVLQQLVAVGEHPSSLVTGVWATDRSGTGVEPG